MDVVLYMGGGLVVFWRSTIDGDMPMNVMEATKGDIVVNLVEPVNKLNKKLLESINESGNVYTSSTVVDGAYIIRGAIGATLTGERHGVRAWKVIQKHADDLLSKY
ncbi:tyrosine/dopa decarboxylase 5 [Quercus suber]|uniref:Tyrosine/dopa decarboxylase 5 n=1 Tax=Quercus suber TaxID=58331 RepID=A0AAW0M245_QUESU